MCVCVKMYVLLKLFLLFAYAQDVRSQSYCKLDNRQSVQYCFDPGYGNGLRRCNSYEAEDVIVRPECTAPNRFFNDSLPPMRCSAGSWENLYSCREEPEKCVLQDGRKGECVAYYVCNGTDDTVIRDGSGIIDIRSSSVTTNIVKSSQQVSPCSSYVELCCDVSDTKQGKPIKPAQRKGVGCGWRNPEGVGGLGKTGADDGKTKFGEFPWACTLYELTEINTNVDKIKTYVGVGSLIHPSAVLTAAHFSTSETRQIRVRAGVTDVNKEHETFPYQDRDVASIAVHPKFNAGNMIYDVALLFLATPMDLTPNVGVACLPPPGERPPEGTRCFATGWGKNKFGRDGVYQDVLKKIEVPVVGHRRCQQQLRQTRLTNYFELHSSFMCAGGEEGVDACRGDGGAPLSCPIESEPGRYMQSGIVAWGIGCGEQGIPGVYVDVARVRDWIDDKMVGKGYDHQVYAF